VLKSPIRQCEQTKLSWEDQFLELQIILAKKQDTKNILTGVKSVQTAKNEEQTPHALEGPFEASTCYEAG
jgi:hypothetical protein